MRYDYFLIWGNGINYTREIVSEIRNDNNFEIILMKKIFINNLSIFINNIYSCDTVPLSHLKAKTQYLLKSKPEVLFILVKNYNPDEQYVGSGSFRHIQCMKINNIKKIIRNKYNPKFKDLNKQILPLNKGVSHEHVIHASDYESQVEHVLKVVNLQSLNYYKRNNNKKINIPYYLDVSNIDPFDINIDNLKANIIGVGLTKITDTPHFKYLLGDKKIYEDYFFRYFGNQLTSDHFPENFDKLIKIYDKNYNKSYPIINNNGQIYDGVHRIAIAKFNGEKTIKVIK